MNELDVRQVMDSRSLAAFVEGLRRLDAGVDDVERVEQLRVLEELKAAAAAAQARVTVAFEASQRAAQDAAGLPARDLGKGIGAQVALARRESPAKGSRFVGLAQALVQEMPHTLAALERGETSEWRATLLVRETACLTREDRTRADAELAARPGGLAALGDRAAVDEARRIAYRLDPFAFTDRARKAAVDRRVTVRPAPDTMALVTGLLPAPQGVAVFAALSRYADSLRACGDPRSRAQIMADTFVERITGQTTAADVPVEVGVVMSDRSLLGDAPEPADLLGYGPVPAPLTRDWIADSEAEAWVRRLYAAPATGQLVAMDSRRRRFRGKLRRLVVYRDRICRTLWCGAPIRHVDHVVPAAVDGPTSAANAQGLCEACNFAKEAFGWRARPDPDGSVETTTPTGHRYLSRQPGTGRSPRATRSRLDVMFQKLVLGA
jgi:hypothetical protein